MRRWPASGFAGIVLSDSNDTARVEPRARFRRDLRQKKVVIRREPTGEGGFVARKGLSKQERSWVLYDVGNSSFVMLSTALIPIYFSSLAEPGSSVVVAWGYAETVS